MRYQAPPKTSQKPVLKIFLEWTTIGIFFFLLFAACLVCYGNGRDAWTNADIDQSKTADLDDIETKITPRSSGVVWGTVQNKASEIAESTPTTPGGVPMPTVTPLPNRDKPAAAPASAEPGRASATLKPAGQTAIQPGSPQTAQPGAAKYLLRSGRQRGSTDLVETLLEVTGDATQIGSDLKEKREKMEVVAGFRYEERIDQFSPTGQLVSIRQYNLAKSRMRVGDNVRMPELASELQTIVCSLEKDKVSLFSPHGSLRGEQLLLIEDMPGNTLTLDRLLPNTEVAVGESWKITDTVLRSFLSVDAVIASDVVAVLTAVADDIAMIEIVGDVSGIYLGAATELSVRAKLQFDLAARRINWLGAMIEECRSIGHVGPGVELVAKLQVKISPLDEPQALTDAVVNTIATRPNEAVLKLKYDGGKGPWRFSHNRDWYVYQDEPQATVLRKLVNGELVAQCNIADMGRVDVQTMSTLSKFQQDLVAGLGDNFGRIALAREYADRLGYRVYKVILDGMVDDLSLRWIYHLLTDTDGTQSIVVFVVEAAMLDQFADTDDVLLETYRMGR